MATIICVDCGASVEGKRKDAKRCAICKRINEDASRAKSMANETQERRAKRLKQKKKYYKKNKDRWREYTKTWEESGKGRAYRQEHSEKNKEYQKQYFQDNKEELMAASKKWNQENRVAYKASRKRISHKRRSALKDPLPDKEILHSRLNLFGGGTCCYCSKRRKLEVEHLVPVSKGGTNDLYNIFGACRSCNASKRDKDLEEWYPQYTFYDPERMQAILTHSKPLEDTYNIQR